MSAEDVLYFVKFVHLMTPRQRKGFFESANQKQMRLLETACLNLAKNHEGLTEQQIKTLHKFKRGIKIMASKGFSIKEKKKIALQKGGFLPSILPIIASLASSLIPALIQRGNGKVSSHKRN